MPTPPASPALADLERAASSWGVVQTPGTRRRVRYGLAATHPDGVVAIDANGAHRVWTPTARPLHRAGIVLLVMAPVSVCVSGGLLAGVGWLVALVVGSLLFVSTLLGVALAALVPLVEASEGLVFDARSRQIEVLRRGRVAHRLPFELAAGARARRAEDDEAVWYDVLVSFGVADIWVAQVSTCDEAERLAQRVGELLGAPVAPTSDT